MTNIKNQIDPQQVKLALITLQTILIFAVGVHYSSKALASYLSDLTPTQTVISVPHIEKSNS